MLVGEYRKLLIFMNESFSTIGCAHPVHRRPAVEAYRDRGKLATLTSGRNKRGTPVRKYKIQIQFTEDAARVADHSTLRGASLFVFVFVPPCGRAVRALASASLGLLMAALSHWVCH